jgi:hypothetical protein
MGWKRSASRTVFGERIYLGIYNDDAETDEIWFRPRKWSIAGQDHIKQLSEQRMSNILLLASKRADLKDKIDAAQKAKAANAGEDAAKLDPWEAAQALGDEDRRALVQMELAESADMLWAELVYGIGEHNFRDETTANEHGDMQLYEDTQQLATDLLEYPDVLEKMVPAIEEMNRPLLRKIGGGSGMPLTSSTTGAPSQQTTAETTTPITPDDSSTSGAPGSSSA